MARHPSPPPAAQAAAGERRLLEYKTGLYEQFARLGRALGSGPRLELLELLAQAERTVEELARLTGLSLANTSQHLQVLRRARLVEARREGFYTRYRLAGPKVYRAWQALRELGREYAAELESVARAYWQNRERWDGISATELRRRVQKGEAIVLDVRPREEYAAGHLPGARSIPLGELQARLRELPKTSPVIAYCRSPYCVLAEEAVASLRAAGRQAWRLELGYPDWQAEGYPVEHEIDDAAGTPAKMPGKNRFPKKSKFRKSGVSNSRSLESGVRR